MTKNLTKALAAVAVLALVAAIVVLVLPGTKKKHLTAEFPKTISLYVGSSVKILGVPVGKVDAITPEGTKVRVRLSYDAKYKLPADAKAVIVSPSVVGDRYVQLTPAYTGGAALADNATLGESRTAVPLELDQIFGSLNDLSKALGPNGANAPGPDGQGALSRLLASTAKNFGGQGQQFNTTLKNLGRLTKTLQDNKDALFGTAKQVEDFVHLVAANDKTVRRFSNSLDQASDLLAGERDDLARALRNLGTALVQVRSFVKDNKTELSRNIKGLLQVSKVLVKRRNALDATLRTAPLALNNLYLAYNRNQGTLDTRLSVTNTLGQIVSDPKDALCSLLSVAPGANKACTSLGGLLNRPGTTLTKRQQRILAEHPVVVQHVDRSLAGLVEVPK